jgi:hypothetical protein
MADSKLLDGEYIGNKLVIFAREGVDFWELSEGQYERIGIVKIKEGYFGRYGRPRFRDRPKNEIYEEGISRGADVLVRDGTEGDNKSFTAGLARIIIPNLRKHLGLSFSSTPNVIP